MNTPLNLLFVCSRNQWRSPTAEYIWRRSPRFNVKSAGTSPKARRTVSAADIQWADWIFVMETKHRQRLCAEFARLLINKPPQVLDIPDEYQYRDAELIQELEDKVLAVLDRDV